MRIFVLALAALSFAAAAEPAQDACRQLAERTLKGSGVAAVVLDDDRHLHLERRARKLGSQPVAATLSGHGALLREAGPPVEMSFVCLLAGGQRALWFHWLPRRDAPALAQCRRGAQPGECLQVLLDVAERDLMELSTQRYHDLMAAGDEAATRAFRDAAGAWRNYRDLECTRRGAPESDAWRACRVDLTRRRYLDLR
jgi:hypothetical protein